MFSRFPELDCLFGRKQIISPFARAFRFTKDQRPATRICELDPAPLFAGEWIYANAEVHTLRYRTAVASVVPGDNFIVVLTEGGLASVFAKPALSFIQHLNGPTGNILIRSVWWCAPASEFVIAFRNSVGGLSVVALQEAAIAAGPTPHSWGEGRNFAELATAQSFVEWDSSLGLALTFSPHDVERTPVAPTASPAHAEPADSAPRVAPSPSTCVDEISVLAQPTARTAASTASGTYTIWDLQVGHRAYVVRGGGGLREVRLAHGSLLLINHTRRRHVLPLRAVALDAEAAARDVHLRIDPGVAIDVLTGSHGRLFFRQRGHGLRVVDLLSGRATAVCLTGLDPRAPLSVELIPERRRAIASAVSPTTGLGMIWIVGYDGTLLAAVGANGPSGSNPLTCWRGGPPLAIPMPGDDAVAVLTEPLDPGRANGGPEMTMLSLSPARNAREGLPTTVALGQLPAHEAPGEAAVYDGTLSSFFVPSASGCVAVYGPALFMANRAAAAWAAPASPLCKL